MTKNEKREAAIKDYILSQGLLDWKKFKEACPEHKDIPQLTFKQIYRKVYEPTVESYFELSHEQAHECLKLIAKEGLTGWNPGSAVVDKDWCVICKAWGGHKPEILASFKGNAFIKNIRPFKAYTEKKTGLVRARLFKIDWACVSAMPNFILVDSEGFHMRWGYDLRETFPQWKFIAN